jgi:hypothetical protein
MTSRKVLLGVLSATVVLTAAGCQSDNSSPASTSTAPVGKGAKGAVSQSAAPVASSPSASASSPYSAASVPDGWKKIGSSVNGFSVAIPKGWVDIDLTASDLKEGLKKAGIEGPSQATLESSLEQLKGLNSLYAIDSATATSGFATNFNGFCQNASKPIYQMKNDAKVSLTQVGATNVDVTETSVGGTSAVQAKYNLKAAIGLLEGLQVQVPVAGGKTCVLTVTARDGSLPSSANQLLNTFTKL